MAKTKYTEEQKREVFYRMLKYTPLIYEDIKPQGIERIMQTTTAGMILFEMSARDFGNSVVDALKQLNRGKKNDTKQKK